jgi:dipeptidase E
MKKIYLIVNLFLLSFLFNVTVASAQVVQGSQNIIFSKAGDIQITNPESTQIFYDELKGKPRDYFVNSAKNFDLYINIQVPEEANANGRYSAKIFSLNDSGWQQISQIDGSLFDWQESYNRFDRDWLLRGPELDMRLLAGKYKIEVYSTDNTGKYVLDIGKNNPFNFLVIVNYFWQLPLLKNSFFKTSILQFFLTPLVIWGIGIIGLLLIILFFINYLSAFIKEKIKHDQAKTLLLTSGGMPQMKDEIVKLLQKPAYDITVAFITTAAKQEENLDYLKKDWVIMKEELRFNVEEFDIEGKTELEVMKFLELKDIIFVEGGNTFYLLNAMRKCNFEKVIKNLLKSGKVYIGVSAGSIVAGRTIQPSIWRGEIRNKNKNTVGLSNFRGLNLVPFDILVHYNRNPEIADLIIKKIPDPRKRAKNLRISTLSGL